MTLPPLKGKSLTIASWIVVAYLLAQWAGWITPPYVAAAAQQAAQQSALVEIRGQMKELALAQQELQRAQAVLFERVENERHMANRIDQRLAAMEMVLAAVERETGAKR